jgi:hypothetical protein
MPEPAGFSNGPGLAGTESAPPAFPGKASIAPIRYPAAAGTMRYEKIKCGFHVIAEGNKWVAVGPEFVNLTESVVGFGDTPLEAITEWMERWSRNPRSCAGRSPRPRDFEAHDDLNGEPELPAFLL